MRCLRWWAAVVAISFGVATTGCHGMGRDSTIPIPAATSSRYHGISAVEHHPTPLTLCAAESREVTAEQHTVDLGVALRLAGVSNPTIELAREMVREALAEQLAARALLIPSVNVGGNYRQHTGALLAASGIVRTVDLRSTNLGFGVGAVGAGIPVLPGVRFFAHLGDAAYAPLAARQRVTVRGSEAAAVQNAVFRDVAVAYLELVAAEARLDILAAGKTDLAEIVRLTKVNAKAGQGRQADADRTETQADFLQSEYLRAEEESAVASARLCRLLNLDPSLRLKTPGGKVEPVRLTNEDVDTESLIREAIQARPEVIARSAAILEARTRVRQEQVRPWVPTVSIGYSYGNFGGGSNETPYDFSSLQPRSNFDVLAVWSLESLGVGNSARVREATANVGGAVAAYDLVVNQIRREVTEAQADANAANRQIETAVAALALAEDGFKLESERIRQGQGRPIEVLDSFRQLLDSRQELLRAVVAFNIAQFRLYVALGRTP